MGQNEKDSSYRVPFLDFLDGIKKKRAMARNEKFNLVKDQLLQKTLATKGRNLAKQSISRISETQSRKRQIDSQERKKKIFLVHKQEIIRLKKRENHLIATKIQK